MTGKAAAKKTTKRKTVSPQQRRSVRARERIFRAAAKVFSQKGLHGARIDEIARRARLNKQRIYAYFGSKKELYRRVLIDAYAQAATNKRLMDLGEEDIPNMTAVILDTFFEFHENHPVFWRLLSWENLNGGKSLGPADWRKLRTAYIRHLRKLYRRGQQIGHFREDVDFTTYLMLLFSTTYFYFSNQLTLSRLLNLELKSGAVRQRIERQLLTIAANGVCR